MKMPTSVSSRIALGIVLCGFALIASGCSPQGENTGKGSANTLPSEGRLAGLPLGEIAGAAKLRGADEIANPLAGDATSIEEGHRLFIAMNCAGCHGYDAKGGMGPNLTDAYWRYGGMPSSIYNSIYEGRPQGMPSWGRALPAQDIWKIVSFVQSLGGTVAANEYHNGLQGDHDITTSAPEARSLIGVFNNPSDAATSVSAQPGTGDATTPPKSVP